MRYEDYFKSIPVMETERFLLTAFLRDKMEEYFDILRDDEVQKYLGGAVPLFDKEPHITNWISNINDRLLKRKIVFTWCVIEKETGKVIGSIDLGGFEKKTVAEISYHFGRSSWGCGTATEVVGRLRNLV